MIITESSVAGVPAAALGGATIDPRRRGTALLNQQFWLWGQDIRHPEGNLLLRYGFERRRSPEDQRGSSAYRLQCDNGDHLDLWGFGVLYRAPVGPGLFVARSRLAPCLVDPDEMTEWVWQPDQLPTRRIPRTRQDRELARTRFVSFLVWIATYESWVGTTIGEAYRQQRLDTWRTAVVPAAELPAAWLAIASWAATAPKQKGVSTQQ